MDVVVAVNPGLMEDEMGRLEVGGWRMEVGGCKEEKCLGETGCSSSRSLHVTSDSSMLHRANSVETSITLKRC